MSKFQKLYESVTKKKRPRPSGVKEIVIDVTKDKGKSTANGANRVMFVSEYKGTKGELEDNLLMSLKSLMKKVGKKKMGMKVEKKYPKKPYNASLIDYDKAREKTEHENPDKSGTAPRITYDFPPMNGRGDSEEEAMADLLMNAEKYSEVVKMNKPDYLAVKRSVRTVDKDNNVDYKHY